MNNKTQINIHTHNYVAAVFADRLRQERFVCPDGKLLCWYRVRNQVILDTIIFCSKWNNLPLSLDIYYETVPLFTRPIYITNVNFNSNSFGRWDCSLRCSIHEGEGSKAAVAWKPYSDDIMVYAPVCANRGLYTLTDVALPYMNKIHTVYECYTVHRERHLQTPPANRYRNMSREFIDEVLYTEDEVVYPYCKERIDRALRKFEDLVYLKPKNQDLQKMQMHWKQLSVAISQNGRAEYMDVLYKREQENIAWLEKKLAIK